MLIEGSKEDIARWLRDRVTEAWGAERAAALQGEIETTAQRLFLVMQYGMGLEEYEPDFLVAPATHLEG